MIINQDAVDVGFLARKLVENYYSYSTLIELASNPLSDELIPKVKPGQLISVGYIMGKSGGEHIYNFNYFLKFARDPQFKYDLDFNAISGSVLQLGDALARFSYFDRSPALELVRHIRNGIAHGNKFDIRYPAELVKYPAHNGNAWISNSKTTLEISMTLQNTPVFPDFVVPGDLVSVIQSVGIYLLDQGNNRADSK